MNRALDICGLPSNICQHVNNGSSEKRSCIRNAARLFGEVVAENFPNLMQTLHINKLNKLQVK